MRTLPNDSITPEFPNSHEQQQGLTKREYFAALALQGLLAASSSHEAIAARAVRSADELIIALNKAKGS